MEHLPTDSAGLAANRFIDLFQNWFVGLDENSTYAYYHGNCTVIDELDRKFMRECEISFQDFRQLMTSDGESGYHISSLLEHIREYVMYLKCVPVPKGKGRKLIKELKPSGSKKLPHMRSKTLVLEDIDEDNEDVLEI